MRGAGIGKGCCCRLQVSAMSGCTDHFQSLTFLLCELAAAARAPSVPSLRVEYFSLCLHARRTDHMRPRDHFPHNKRTMTMPAGCKDDTPPLQHFGSAFTEGKVAPALVFMLFPLKDVSTSLVK